jgi:hypothetical protein
MIALIGGIIAAVLTPNAATSATICEVGRLALRDLPTINTNRTFDAYYAGVDTTHQDLLEVCPELTNDVPEGYPLADADARSRASVHAPPLSGQRIREAFIYSINIPQVSADSKTAIVQMGYSCTGLCGAGFEAVYVRTNQGWKRQGEIRNLFVS